MALLQSDPVPRRPHCVLRTLGFGAAWTAACPLCGPSPESYPAVGRFRRLLCHRARPPRVLGRRWVSWVCAGVTPWRQTSLSQSSPGSQRPCQAGPEQLPAARGGQARPGCAHVRHAPEPVSARLTAAGGRGELNQICAPAGSQPLPTAKRVTLTWPSMAAGTTCVSRASFHL